MQTYVYLFLGESFVPAGLLRTEGHGPETTSRFAYGRGYLENRAAQPIDPISLPLHTREYTSDIGSEIFNVIRDAAPDLWGRYLLEKRFNRTLSELEYALAAGPQRAGALAFGPDLSGPQRLGLSGFEPCRSVSLDLGLVMSAAEDAIANEDTARLKQLLEYGPSVGGARPKAALTWDGQSQIAKFSTSLDSRNEPRLEFGTMRLAKQIGLDVPEISLLRIAERDVYLIRRFDRSGTQEKEFPIHTLSGLTACNLHERDYSAWSYRALADAVLRLSAEPQRDLQELYRRMIFNILVNNDDDHMRNHSFLYTGNGRWRLSPLYDVVPRDQLSNTFRLALQVGTWGKEASRRNALSGARYFDIAADAAERIWQEMAQFVDEHWEEFFLEAGLDENTVARFRTCVGEQHTLIG